MERIRVSLAAYVPVEIDDGSDGSEDGSVNANEPEQFPSEGGENAG